jgi:hypothetical protein
MQNMLHHTNLDVVRNPVWLDFLGVRWRGSTLLRFAGRRRRTEQTGTRTRVILLLPVWPWLILTTKTVQPQITLRPRPRIDITTLPYMPSLVHVCSAYNVFFELLVHRKR